MQYKLHYMRAPVRLSFTCMDALLHDHGNVLEYHASPDWINAVHKLPEVEAPVDVHSSLMQACANKEEFCNLVDASPCNLMPGERCNDRHKPPV